MISEIRNILMLLSDVLIFANLPRDAYTFATRPPMHSKNRPQDLINHTHVCGSRNIYKYNKSISERNRRAEHTRSRTDLGKTRIWIEDV